jgi:hypothetical protein
MRWRCGRHAPVVVRSTRGVLFRAPLHDRTGRAVLQAGTGRRAGGTLCSHRVGDSSPVRQATLAAFRVRKCLTREQGEPFPSRQVPHAPIDSESAPLWGSAGVSSPFGCSAYPATGSRGAPCGPSCFFRLPSTRSPALPGDSLPVSHFLFSRVKWQCVVEQLCRKNNELRT